MKLDDLRQKTISDLKEELVLLRKTQFGLKLQHKTQQLGNVSQIRKIRKNIAQLKTIIGEKKISYEFK
ncbi:50S ribosomal protein L29 [Nitrosomonas sp.]|uniref:50S ribosomal protein L29 n=1 Tax=Nitrosomonas sp. TaxID=42353 RepID=UPI0025F76B03|nr:50S ribosomal protein L29 [Nitrosomonas sp.]MBE7526490.1 50S ribosomal protein L29 [Burkholderiales bacterium]